MWQVRNATPFEAAGNWVRDRDGAEVWIVAVRGAFDILPDGTTSLAERQEPPVLAPIFGGDPVASSMLEDSDFHLSKPTSDVLIQGSACAPVGRRVTRMDVIVRVGPVTKTLRVTGDRRYERSVGRLVPGAPEPFERMPITYERAYGGNDVQRDGSCFDERNPVGCGFAALAGGVVPNIEYVDDPTRPAGFGPIAPHWLPRRAHAGTYDADWQRTRMPLYPTDLDDRFFQCAPVDQRPAEHLRGGESVDLHNLTAEGRMSFLLPRIAFRFETRFRNKGIRAHRPLLKTIVILPDRRRLVMVWQSALPAHVDVHRLEETSVRSLPVVPLGHRS